MESVYWVVCWACHRRCRHCYDDRFRPYVRAELEAVVAQAEHAWPRILANLPERLDRLVLAGGEVLLEPVRERVLFPLLDAARASRPETRVIVQTTGDLVTPERIAELVAGGIWMISVAGLDDHHVGHEGDGKTALRARLADMFAAAGVRPSGHHAPLRGWQEEDGPVYGLFGATPDTWIGRLWPRGRAATNNLSTAGINHNFCADWSGGRGFLNPHAGAEVSIEPDGSVYPCCVKTGVALGDLTEERLDTVLASLRENPVFEAISRGDPAAMGESLGLDRAGFLAACGEGEGANLCTGCERVHAKLVAPVIAAIREARCS